MKTQHALWYGAAVVAVALAAIVLGAPASLACWPCSCWHAR